MSMTSLLEEVEGDALSDFVPGSGLNRALARAEPRSCLGSIMAAETKRI